MRHQKKLHELLERAGLTVVEDVRPGSLFPPEAGWRIARGIAAPDGVAREALDVAWWRRLRDIDGEFLVAVLGHRIGGNDSWWTRVRHAGSGVPELTGDPGFVALSLDGQVLLAEVPGEGGPRVTALDRLPERLEEAAEAAGRETEVERAEVWAAVPGRRAWPLHWAEGIGFNPAATDELLIRLLDVEEGFLHGCDRPAVLDAAVAHPDPRVRSRPADTFRPKLTSDQWVRLVRAEPSPHRRVLWAERACVWGTELPEDLYDDLLAGPSRARAAELPGLPARHLPDLAADADPRVRSAACARWEDLAAPLRERLLADTDDAVRTAALLAHHTAYPCLARFSPPCPNRGQRSNGAASRPTWRRSWSGTGTRKYVGRWPPTRAWARTASPCWRRTRRTTSAPRWRCAPTSPRSNVPRSATTSTRRRCRTPCPGSRSCTATPTRCAVSPRRPTHWSAAVWLEPGTFRRMSWRAWRGTRTGRSACSSPNRARTPRPTCCWRSGAGGTAASATPVGPAAIPTSPVRACCATPPTPAGRMRRLALDDPESTSADVARLARDPEAEVRRRAAEDPRLSPADAVRLLNDPEAHVRDTAVRNPRLPARVLAGLLHFRDTACAAVTNPAIPIPVLHRILTAAAAAVAARH